MAGLRQGSRLVVYGVKSVWLALYSFTFTFTFTFTLISLYYITVISPLYEFKCSNAWDGTESCSLFWLYPDVPLSFPKISLTAHMIHFDPIPITLA